MFPTKSKPSSAKNIPQHQTNYAGCPFLLNSYSLPLCWELRKYCTWRFSINGKSPCAAVASFTAQWLVCDWSKKLASWKLTYHKVPTTRGRSPRYFGVHTQGIYEAFESILRHYLNISKCFAIFLLKFWAR